MNIFITGASSGIGRALAWHYLGQGHTVAVIARREDRLQSLCEQAAALPGRLFAYVGDVSDRERMAEVVATAEHELGTLDLVIANAGVAAQQCNDDLDLERFMAVTETNVLGVLNTLLPVLKPMMARRCGQIAVISSLSAIKPVPMLAVYGASKAWANYLTDALYGFLKNYGITITTVCPGFILTELTQTYAIPARQCMDLQQATARIAKAIARKKRFDIFPLWSYFLLCGAGLLSRGLRDKAIIRFFRRFQPSPG